MATFLALYRGDTVGEASLVAVTTDRDLVARVADEMLERERRSGSADPVEAAVDEGRRKALRLVRDEAVQDTPADSGGGSDGG